MSYKDILSLIETVDPADTAKLDEIDARVWCWMQSPERSYGGIVEDSSETHIGGETKEYPYTYTLDENKMHKNEIHYFNPWRKYTRSRGALKAIRPQQGCSVFRIFNSDNWDTWQAQIAWYPTHVAKYCTSPHLPTEELAELHAIIQAIAYERGE